MRGKKLIETLLQKSPGQRLGADWNNVKEHKFFKSEPKLFSKIIGRELAPPHIPAGERYSDEYKLAAISLSDAEELADGSISSFQEQIATQFRQFDTNGGGKIVRTEMRTILKAIHPIFFTDEIVDALMTEVDEDTSGGIDYREFLKDIFSGAQAELFSPKLNL